MTSCGHIDWPCCGCGDDEVLTGQDALDAMNENDVGIAIDDEPWDGFLTDAAADGDALAAAGHGTDEDYGFACDMACEGYDEH